MSSKVVGKVGYTNLYSSSQMIRKRKRDSGIKLAKLDDQSNDEEWESDSEEDVLVRKLRKHNFNKNYEFGKFVAQLQYTDSERFRACIRPGIERTSDKLIPLDQIAANWVLAQSKKQRKIISESTAL